jgi:hypothetical protein
MIEQTFPTAPKLEMFAHGPVRAGWESWGAEASQPPPRVLVIGRAHDPYAVDRRSVRAHQVAEKPRTGLPNSARGLSLEVAVQQAAMSDQAQLYELRQEHWGRLCRRELAPF